MWVAGRVYTLRYFSKEMLLFLIGHLTTVTLTTRWRSIFRTKISLSFSFLHIFKGSRDLLLIPMILQAHGHSCRAEVPGQMQGSRDAGVRDAGIQAHVPSRHTASTPGQSLGCIFGPEMMVREQLMLQQSTPKVCDKQQLWKAKSRATKHTRAVCHLYTSTCVRYFLLVLLP